MSEKKVEYYRMATEEEIQAGGLNPDYHHLIGPDGFECFLGEPEDRTWYRDGKAVVDELNRLQAEINRLLEALP